MLRVLMIENGTRAFAELPSCPMFTLCRSTVAEAVSDLGSSYRLNGKKHTAESSFRNGIFEKMRKNIFGFTMRPDHIRH